ncbi:MAG: hypothetical protein ABSH17_00395 [Syntrophobacteraceae bacterium]
MKKVLTIIQLALISGLIIYGTICLYMGDFIGAYAAFPVLLVYYVWFVAGKRRQNQEKTDGR